MQFISRNVSVFVFLRTSVLLFFDENQESYDEKYIETGTSISDFYWLAPFFLEA